MEEREDRFEFGVPGRCLLWERERGSESPEKKETTALVQLDLLRRVRVPLLLFHRLVSTNERTATHLKCEQSSIDIGPNEVK
jgi:hypothetical protein